MDQQAGIQSSEITKVKQKKEWKEDSLRDSWNNIKYTNIHIARGPRGKREKWTENFLKT